MASKKGPSQISPTVELPEPRANATEVRKYLAQALQDRGMAIGQSVQVSKKWTTGTGAELRSHSLTTYRKMFGPDPEEVWQVYMAVQPQVIRERQANDYTHQQKVLMLVACLFASFSFPILAFSGRNIALMMVSFVVGLLGVVMSMYLGVLVFEEQDPYKIAEQELRAKPGET